MFVLAAGGASLPAIAELADMEARVMTMSSLGRGTEAWRASKVLWMRDAGEERNPVQRAHLPAKRAAERGAAPCRENDVRIASSVSMWPG